MAASGQHDAAGRRIPTATLDKGEAKGEQGRRRIAQVKGKNKRKEMRRGTCLTHLYILGYDKVK